MARAKGHPRGRQPKLSPKQRGELRRMHANDDYSITDLAELFSVSRPNGVPDPPSGHPKRQIALKIHRQSKP